MSPSLVPVRERFLLELSEDRGPIRTRVVPILSLLTETRGDGQLHQDLDIHGHGGLGVWRASGGQRDSDTLLLSSGVALPPLHSPGVAERQRCLRIVMLVANLD